MKTGRVAITYSFKDILKQPVIRNLILVGGLTLLVKGIGFYKESVIASSFGLSELLDTYLIALLIPGFINEVFIGALKNIFIPNYITELKTTKRAGAFQTLAFSIIMLIMSSLTLIFIVFGNLFFEALFPGHSEHFYYLIRVQFYYLLPCLFFWGFITMLSGLLEVESKFFYTTITPVSYAITILICLFFFKEDLGVKVLAVGTLAGSVLNFLFLLVVSLQYKIIIFGRLKLNENMRLMIQQLPPKVTSGLLTGLNAIIDRFFAAQLTVGSITAISYGIKVPAFVISVIMVALGNVLLPHFSRLVIKDMEKAYHQLFKVLQYIFIGSFFVVILTIVFSPEIISLLFERDKFTAQDTIVVSDIQKITLIYVPFYLCTLVLVKFLTSINKNSFMAWTSFFNLISNIVLNIILVKMYGVYGLVMSTTIVLITSSLIYIGYTYRKYQEYKRNLSVN